MSIWKCTFCPESFTDRSRAEAHGTGYSVTLLQIRLAWEKHFGLPIPGNVPFDKLANQLRQELGCDVARDFMLSMK